MATPREQLAALLRQARLEAGFEPHGALARKLNVLPSRAGDLSSVLVAITTKTAGQPGRQAGARMDLAQFETPYVVAV